jgi:hypothetical protein
VVRAPTGALVVSGVDPKSSMYDFFLKMFYIECEAPFYICSGCANYQSDHIHGRRTLHVMP